MSECYLIFSMGSEKLSRIAYTSVLSVVSLVIDNPFQSREIHSVFEQYPSKVKNKLMFLRHLIFGVAV